MHRKILTDTVSNLLNTKDELIYIVEPDNWSIKWDGHYITSELNRMRIMNARISTSRFLHRKKILHFGSSGTLIDKAGIKRVHPSNNVICTWFHISQNDERLNFIPVLNEIATFVHTSCLITEQELISYGLKKNKIITIPLGIDLNTFRQLDNNRRILLRKMLQLPENKIIIGSFQKDGVGWGQGNDPKLIKGPDIFCDVIEKLSDDYDIHVLLTGPARGYVKNRLEAAGVSFTHSYLKNYLDITNYYNVLDLYLLTSRAEGGPKAITESMACGIPIVSTRVGMAPEVIDNNKNGLLSDIDDIESLLNNCKRILEDNALKEQIVENALADVKNYSWTKITKMYYDKIYKNLK